MTTIYETLTHPRKYSLLPPPSQDILPGFVLCDPSSPCHVGQKFEAQIVILEHKSIICAGYSAILHIHSVVEEVQISVSSNLRFSDVECPPA